MNTFKKLLQITLLPLNIMNMEVKQTSLANVLTQENNENAVMPKGFPIEVKIKIFKDMIDAVQTVPECDNLFKAVIEINKDLPKKRDNKYKQRFFRSALFNEIGLKKYKILYEVDQKIKKSWLISQNEFDIINKGINTRNKVSVYTALESACWQGHLDIVSYLISKGARVNVPVPKYHHTSLYLTSYNGNVEIAGLLLKNGALVNVQDYTNETPLHVAAKKYLGGAKYVKLVDLLIRHGADVNAQNCWGWTPLHIASSCEAVGIVDLLIKKGADISIINNEGHTALDVAKRNKYEAIVDLLVKAQGTSK